MLINFFINLVEIKTCNITLAQTQKSLVNAISMKHLLAAMVIRTCLQTPEAARTFQCSTKSDASADTPLIETGSLSSYDVVSF